MAQKRRDQDDEDDDVIGFSTFLNESSRLDRDEAQAEPPPNSRDTTARVLVELKTGPQNVRDLAPKVGLGLVELVRFLDRLSEVGLVNIQTSKSGDESVELTRAGANLARTPDLLK